MKTISLLTVTLFLAMAAPAQPPMAPPAQPPMTPPGQPGFQQRLQAIISKQDASPTVAAKEPVNYLIRVEWKEPKGGPEIPGSADHRRQFQPGHDPENLRQN